MKTNTPDGWLNGRIDNFLVLQRGYDLTEKQAKIGNIPVISSSGFSYFHNESKVSAPGVVTGRKGKIGNVFYIEEDFWPHDTTLWVKDFKGNDPKYISVFLRHLNLERFDEASSVPTLNRNYVHKQKCLFPPFEEQKAIANVLSTWDRAISTTERLIQAKEKKLEAYGVSLFDRKQNGKYPDWEVVKLKEVLVEHGHKSTGKEEVYSVSVHKGLVNQVEHLGRSFSAAKTDHYNRVLHGDIVYTKSPTGDFPLGIVKQSYASKDVIVSPLYGVFTPQTYHLGVVIDFYFSSPQRAKNYLFPIIQKGAKNTIAITNKTFLSKQLHLPIEESEQKVVAEYVETARKEIDLLKKLADQYKIQKRGLMQKLLTGIWRVKGM